VVFNAQGAAYGSYNDSVGPESETDRQTFQIREWEPPPFRSTSESMPDGDDDTDDIGYYRALGPVVGRTPPEAFNFPGVGQALTEQPRGGSMYG
jgi:hypothetical protein